VCEKTSKACAPLDVVITSKQLSPYYYASNFSKYDCKIIRLNTLSSAIKTRTDLLLNACYASGSQTFDNENLEFCRNLFCFDSIDNVYYGIY